MTHPPDSSAQDTGSGRPGGYRWTIGLSLVLLLLNLGLWDGSPAPFKPLLTTLEFDGTAIRQGELWRLVTGNLVHFGPMHFYLDVGVFFILGLLYEPHFKRAFPWLLLWMCVAIGLACLVWMDERTRMRGLSGVDTGLFAAVIWIEFGLAWRDPFRWWWVAPAAALFMTRTAYEAVTGQSFFSTQSLLGPIKLATTAHNAGIASALVFMLALHYCRKSASP